MSQGGDAKQQPHPRSKNGALPGLGNYLLADVTRAPQVAETRLVARILPMV
jgi:hypothetical protein